jgi:hypothetical protein
MAQFTLTDKTANELVFIGTMTEIYPAPSTPSLRKWVVVAYVDKVVHGEFAGTTSASQFTARRKQDCESVRPTPVKATWTGSGYTVDELQWTKRKNARLNASKNP